MILEQELNINKDKFLSTTHFKRVFNSHSDTILTSHFVTMFNYHFKTMKNSHFETILNCQYHLNMGSLRARTTFKKCTRFGSMALTIRIHFWSQHTKNRNCAMAHSLWEKSFLAHFVTWKPKWKKINKWK